jgi:hypothetical protein
LVDLFELYGNAWTYKLLTKNGVSTLKFWITSTTMFKGYCETAVDVSRPTVQWWVSHNKEDGKGEAALHNKSQKCHTCTAVMHHNIHLFDGYTVTIAQHTNFMLCPIHW